jgi:ubiquinone/menaquinone biosynthesis C-methylase UbiE
MINGLERPIIWARDAARRRMISDERVELLKSHVRDYYDGVAKTWDATHGSESYNPHFERQLQDRLKLLIAESAGKALAVELGAGTGPYLNITAPLFGKLIATDISGGMLAVLEARVAHLGLSNVVVLQQDAYDLRAIESASADVVYSVGLLETITDFHRLFAEVHRVLKPGGTVAGITSNGNCPWYVLRRIIEGGERHARTGRLATGCGLKHVLQQVGFTTPEITYWGAVRPQMRSQLVITALAAAEKVIAPTPAARYLGVLSFSSRKKRPSASSLGTRR